MTSEISREEFDVEFRRLEGEWEILKIVIEFSNNPISDLLNFLSFQLANENFLPERTIIPNTSLTFLINGYDRSLIEITSPPISTLIVG